MEYKSFVYGLGDLVLGFQVLEGNLHSYFQKKEGHLSDFSKEFAAAFGKETAEKYQRLVEAQDYYSHQVAKSFMDEEDFENSDAFEAACDRLQEDRKLLYSVNAEVMQAYMARQRGA